MSILLFMIFGLVSEAKALDLPQEWIKKIESACTKAADDSRSAKINLKDACECIANVHYNLAKREEDKGEAEDQLKWVLTFYQTTDKSKLKELLGEDPVTAEIDMQVAEECIK